MQNKDFLLPLLGVLGAILAVVGLFLGAWNLLVDGTVVETFTFFSDFEGAAAQLGVESVASIWGTLSMVLLIVGIVAVVANVIMKTVKAGERVNYNVFSKVLTWVAIISLLAFIVFGIVFTSVNTGSIGEGEALVNTGFSFGIGFWLGLIGLAFGTFFTAVGLCVKKAV